MTGIGHRIYGLAAIAFGVLGLASGDFASVWQPFPDAIPGRVGFAYAIAALFLAAGIGMQLRRTIAPAALVLAALGLLFAFGWGQRVAAMPLVLGTWLGVCEQLALVIAGLVVYARLASAGWAGGVLLGGRVAFGLCLLVFGAAHLVYVPETAAMVPAWLPPGTRFWAIATGVAHIAAGLALVSGVRALLAARLACAMFVGFGLLVWLPKLFGAPDHMAWAGNAINLALVGAAWVMADMIAAVPLPGIRRGRN